MEKPIFNNKLLRKCSSTWRWKGGVFACVCSLVKRLAAGTDFKLWKIYIDEWNTISIYKNTAVSCLIDWRFAWGRLWICFNIEVSESNRTTICTVSTDERGKIVGKKYKNQEFIERRDRYDNNVRDTVDNDENIEHLL